MAVGRRYLTNVPRLTGRSWEGVAQELENFLKRNWDSEADGIPPGHSSAIPQTVAAGATGSAGAETDGWSAGGHIHPVATGTPVGLGFAAEEGISTSLTRSDHVHPYLDLYEDLVVSYRLEEAGGVRFPSIGPYLLTEWPGSIGSNTGKIGQAAEFTGTEVLYINGTGSELAQGSFDYSVCCWVYLDSVAAIQYIVAKDHSTAGREYGVLYDPAAAGGLGAFQAFLQTSVPTTYTVTASDIVPTTGTWYFVHYWYVHAESNIYIRVNDGTTYSTSCNGETPRVVSSALFMLGARRTTSPANFLSGRADALHWHQRALTEGEHEILYAGGDGRELWLPVGLVPSVLPVSTKTANYTVQDGDGVLLVDATSGAVTITLQAAAGQQGRRVWVKKIDSSTNTVTVDGNGAETIDDLTTYGLLVQYEVIGLVCDGTEWWVI